MPETYLVRLEAGVWLAGGQDMNRTLVRDNAKRYRGIPAAIGALTRARRHRPFKNAAVETDSGWDSFDA